MTLLGAAKEAAATEEAGWGLILIGILATGGPNDRLAVANKQPNLDAVIVPGLNRKILQDALTEAVRNMVVQNASAIPGHNLGTISGIAAPTAPPAVPTPH